MEQTNAASAANEATEANAHTSTFMMEVSKKGKLANGETGYIPVGKVPVPLFSLVSFGLPVEATGFDADNQHVYADPRHQYVYDAIVMATKADARNKLAPSSTDLKPGCVIAQTVDDLIAKAERSGAALALNREFLADFAAYLKAKSGKTEGVQALYNGMVKTRASITLSSEARRNGLQAQLGLFLDQLEEVKQAKYVNILTTLDELCRGEVALDDSDL